MTMPVDGTIGEMVFMVCLLLLLVAWTLYCLLELDLWCMRGEDT